MQHNTRMQFRFIESVSGHFYSDLAPGVKQYWYLSKYHDCIGWYWNRHLDELGKDYRAREDSDGRKYFKLLK